MQTLANFYETGYFTLIDHRRNDGMSVEGLFVTDCGILFVRHQNQTSIEIVQTLLRAVEDLNRRLFAHNIETTASIAFGDFRYSPLNEYDGMEKNYIFGDAYVDAFKDNGATPKLEPGMCRVLVQGFNFNADTRGVREHPIWSRCCREGGRLYFYWMCNDAGNVEQVKQRYEQANQSRFQVIHKTLQDCSTTWATRGAT